MLYIDCRMIKGSGIATYLNNLIKIYKNNKECSNYQYLVNDLNSFISKGPHYKNQHFYDSKIYSSQEQFNFPKVMNESDILHVPHYNAPLRFKGKLIVTIHDVCHFVMKKFFSRIDKRIYSSIFMKAVLKKADVIIAVSEFTKTEIVKYFDISPKKIKVIYNGLDPYFYQRSIKEQRYVKSKYELPSEYILYAGNIKPHKNIVGLIMSYYEAKEVSKNLPKLVIVGQKDENFKPFSELKNISENKKALLRRNIIFKNFVPYEDLPAIYSGADFFIFPSFYEGFGFPPLESMACGTPVIASNTSSLPETLGDCALMFNPYDKDTLSKKIISLWENIPLKENLRNLGKCHIKNYNWVKTAEKYLKIYRSLSEKKKSVLFIDQYGDIYGGGQIILVDIIKYLKKTKPWKITMALPSKGNLANKIIDHVDDIFLCPVAVHEIKRNSLSDSIIYIMSSIIASYKLYRICRKQKVSLIYCNGGRVFLMSWIVGLFIDLKVVWHLHLVLNGRQKKLVELLGKSNWILSIIAVSETTKSVFKKKSIKRKIKVLMNWVDTSFISNINKISKKKKFGFLKILIVGRISQEKGQFELIKSLREMDKTKFEISLVGEFVSDQNYKNKFNDLLCNMTKKGFNIKLLGYVDNIRNVLDKHDFLLIPSLVPEAFGITAIEAMSRGLIVIANQLGSLNEYIQHGETGLFYQSNNPENIQNLFIKILNHKYELTKIRKKAYHLVRSNFTSKTQLPLIEKIIDNKNEIN